MSLPSRSVPEKNITGKRACNYSFKPGTNFTSMGKGSILMCLESICGLANSSNKSTVL
jgi:hypothetical protein